MTPWTCIFKGPILAYLLSIKFSDIHGNAQFLSATFLGLIAGTLISGPCSDRFGRRLLYQLNLLLFGVASIAAAFAPTLQMLVLCRVFMGIGLGGEVIVSYGTLTEFLPPHVRAMWQGKLAFLSNLAIPCSAVLCAVMLPAPGWRAVFGLVGVLAIVVWLPRRLIPESPRWYEAQGRDVEADRTLIAIEREVETATGASLPDCARDNFGQIRKDRAGIVVLFRGQLLRRTLLAIWLMVCMNAAIYTFVAWLPTILMNRGVDIKQTFLLTLLMQLGALPGAIGGTWVAEKYGRRQAITVLSAVAAGSQCSTEWPEDRCNWW